MRLLDSEIEEMYRFVELKTGACHQGRFRKDIILTNVQRLMLQESTKTWSEMVERSKSNTAVMDRLLTAITIHTTSWFREAPHLDYLTKWLETHYEKYTREKLRVWTAACSTGEESYSFAMVLETFRQKNPRFDYEIKGTDIDPISVRRASRCIFTSDQIHSIPAAFQSHLWIGSGRTKGLFTLDPEIRSRVKFDTWNLDSGTFPNNKQLWDIIICRNVLIYFDQECVKRITQRFCESVSENGLMILGHSETLPQSPEGFSFHGNSIYARGKHSAILNSNSAMREKQAPKILIIDDSKSVRLTIAKELSRKGFTVVEAISPAEATAVIRRESVDAVTLDLNMLEPNDGFKWLAAARRENFNQPVIIVTDARPDEADNIFKALESGAQDYIQKSFLAGHSDELSSRLLGLIEASQSALLPTSRSIATATPNTVLTDPVSCEAIVIGSSTGGPEALSQLLEDIASKNARLPPVIIVQHISPNFALAFSKRLAHLSGLKLANFAPQTKLESGHLYMSPGDQHIALRRTGRDLTIELQDGPQLSGHRPSVDFLFESAARANAQTLAILLTGMGKDGANGMLALKKQKNSTCIAQDQATSVVYGMPREAVRLGAVDYSASVQEIRNIVISSTPLQSQVPLIKKRSA